MIINYKIFLVHSCFLYDNQQNVKSYFLYNNQKDVKSYFFYNRWKINQNAALLIRIASGTDRSHSFT